MAGHLLVLEHAARVLAVAGRAVRAVRNGNAVGRAETAEAPALHRAGETLALGHAGDVDQLARNEMVGADRRADVEQRILGDPELRDLGLGRAELDGGVAVTVRFAAADDLQLVQLEDGDGHMPTVRLEQAGHSDLLRDHAGAHDQNSSNRGTWEIPCACSPSNFLRAPPGLVLPKGAAGTQPGASLRRYHPSRGPKAARLAVRPV